MIASDSDINIDDYIDPVFDDSELNTTLEYDDNTGSINYAPQFEALIISNVFIVFSISLVCGILLGRMFFRR